MRRLFFKLYHAGLTNCRMSLEIGVALAHLTGRMLAPYNVRPPWSSDPLLPPGADYSRAATVLDLFDLPVPLDCVFAAHEEINIPGARKLLSAPVYESVLRVEPIRNVAEDDFRAFRNGREHVATLGADIREDEDLIVDVPTLGLYSYFFYANAATQANLRRVLHQVCARQPYSELADRVAGTLAPFNAVHIRRGDFRYAGCGQRSGQATGQEVSNHLASRLSHNDRLVICTDTSRDDWFDPLYRQFREIVFLDRLLLESDYWRSELQALPHHDDTVLGLVTQLVAARAECFVGTLFSTFSAVIQRLRAYQTRKPDFLYCYSDWDPEVVPFERCEFVPTRYGPYTWNRISYPVHPNVNSWFREWPEAIECPPAVQSDTPIPRSAIMLRASEARVHGLEARYEQTSLLDNIGYWTDPGDFVTWEFCAARKMVCRVEIRYACSDESAGSAYCVDIEGGRLSGTVLPTGGWTAFSNWQTLGNLQVSAGRQVLAVRALTMPAVAVMNLAGLRLVPVQTN